MHTKDDPEWPPGTVRLEGTLSSTRPNGFFSVLAGYVLINLPDLLGSSNKNGQVILQPRPTRDPNDPLVCQSQNTS